jgi:hypothetical protein
MSGTRRINAIPNGAIAANQSIQLMVTPEVFRTISTASGFGAIPVRKRVLLMEVAEIAVHMRYEPTRRADGSLGIES